MKLLTLLLLIPFACPAQSLTLEEKRTIATKLIQGQQAKEELELCGSYIQIQKNIIVSKDSVIGNLETSMLVTENQRDSLHQSEVNLKLDLNKVNRKLKRRNGLLAGGAVAVLIEVARIFISIKK